MHFVIGLQENVSDAVNKGKSILRREGWGAFLGIILKRCIRIVFYYESLLVYELDLTRPLPEFKIPISLTYRIAREEDILGFDKKHYDCDEKAKKYLIDRFQHGDRCILAEHSREVVGYLFIMRKGEMELSQYEHMQISPNRSYIYKGFVKKEFRGNRILLGLDSFIIERLREEGASCIVTLVGEKNFPSRRARYRTGFREIGKILQVQIACFNFNYIPIKYKNYLQSTI